MRLWSLHPKYLDAKGLVALWREALLAKHVLAGRTKGYRHHPQLQRFQAHRNPSAAINSYLREVWNEATARGYRFNKRKVGTRFTSTRIAVTSGQMAYEFRHLKRKLAARDKQHLKTLADVKRPTPHPSFRIKAGTVEKWEKIS